MLIGILSDTHDHMDHVRRAVTLFRERGVARVLHAGDHVNPGSVRLFEGLPLTGVFGNNDGDQFNLTRSYDAIGGELLGDFGVVELLGRRIALYHGTAPAITDALVASGHHDLVVSGHTHQWVDRQAGPTRWLNPGTAHGFGKNATLMLLDLAGGGVERIELRSL